MLSIPRVWNEKFKFIPSHNLLVRWYWRVYFLPGLASNQASHSIWIALDHTASKWCEPGLHPEIFYFPMLRLGEEVSFKVKTGREVLKLGLLILSHCFQCLQRYSVALKLWKSKLAKEWTFLAVLKGHLSCYHLVQRWWKRFAGFDGLQHISHPDGTLSIKQACSQMLAYIYVSLLTPRQWWGKGNNTTRSRWFGS